MFPSRLLVGNIWNSILRKPNYHFYIRYYRNLNNQDEFNDSLLKEDSFRRICRDKIINSKDAVVKCHLLHHYDPYLKLGNEVYTFEHIFYGLV